MKEELLPFVQFVYEDKSKYQTATDAGYYDPDGDFLIGNSGGFLFNINFVFRNTHLLRKAALEYERNDKYIDAPYDSPSHRRFRVQEESRRVSGFTARCKLLHSDIATYDRLVKNGHKEDADKLLKPLHITGEHYNLINYGIMSKLDEKSVTVSKSGQVTGIKHDGIPSFFGSQYWWYKAKRFAKNNGFHIIGGKARRAGFSYMEGIGSANSVNSIRKSTVIHAASDLKYLTDGRSLTRMALMQLEFYELHTPFKRGILSRKLTDIYLGWKDKKNIDDGYQSHILSLTTGGNNPEVAVGKDALEIKCEEMSVFDNFDEFMKVTEPTTRTGSITTGLIVAWGTGGSEEGNWETFERNYYNPERFRFMPFENVWDKDSRDRVCGYYKPYIDSLQGFTVDGRAAMDRDGNTDYNIAAEIYKEERRVAKEKAKTVHDYVIYCGQYSNMPSESFSSTSDNIFTSEKLSAHINRVRSNPDYKFYTDGMPVMVEGTIKFKSNFRLLDEGVKVHPYIEDIIPRSGTDRYGCTRIWHMPYRNKDGVVPDIYSVSYDPVGKDKQDPTNKNSNNSLSVWMNPNIYFHNVTKLRVANFYGRPPLMETMDGIARDICYLYGGHTGMMLAEVNRGETKSNFRKWNCVRLLAKAPVEVWDVKVKGKIADEYGIDLTNDIRKLQGLELLKEMLYTVIGTNDDGTDKLFLETIPDLAFLLEIQKWHNEGNFDRVSDAIVEAFANKKMKLTAAKKLERRTKVTNHVMKRAWF